MTIDEAIERERQQAKEQRKEMQCKTCKLFARSDLHPLQGYCRKNEFHSIEIDSWRKVCSEYVPTEMCKCAEEHEQLAEWLEELKCYKNDNDFSDYAERLHKIAFNSGYNKAIEDFAEKMKYEYGSDEIHETIDDIAEQLKAGVDNETN